MWFIFQGDLSLKPQLLNGLTSGRFYEAAAASIFQDDGLRNQGHAAVLQILNRIGIHVSDDQKTLVTETMLNQMAPFRKVSHRI